MLSGVDHMTSFTGAGAVAMSNPSLLSRLEERRTSEWELGKITSFKACDRATIIAEEKDTFDIDEEIKRSLCNLNDVEGTIILCNYGSAITSLEAGGLS